MVADEPLLSLLTARLEKIKVADEGLGRPTASSGTTLSSSSMVLGHDEIRILRRYWKADLEGKRVSGSTMGEESPQISRNRSNGFYGRESSKEWRKRPRNRTRQLERDRLTPHFDQHESWWNNRRRIGWVAACRSGKTGLHKKHADNQNNYIVLPGLYFLRFKLHVIPTSTFLEHLKID